jgi:transcriptional regulator with XRE-family HTH domain
MGCRIDGWHPISSTRNDTSSSFRNYFYLIVKKYIKIIKIELTIMKVSQSSMLSPLQLEECVRLGRLLARLRIARKVKQTDAALRSGLSRNTVYRLEKGDPGLAFGQVLRYLEAIAPGSDLLALLSEADPALLALAAREKTQRVRDMSIAELKELEF